MAFIISYKSEDRYSNKQEILCAIKKYEHWAIVGDNTYIICSKEATVASIRKQLHSYCRIHDKLFVAELQGNSAWNGYGEQFTLWMEKNFSK